MTWRIRSLAAALIFLAATPYNTVPASAAAADPGVREYVWLTAGEPSGAQTVRRLPDGRLSVSFAFNDRGRGPDMEIEIALDGDGNLTSFAATGVNYAKGPVDERFDIEGGVARWRSSLEQGETEAPGNAIYFPVNAPPEFRAILARALLARPDFEIDLLPSGRVRIGEAARLTLHVEGADREAILYAITGLDLAPTYVWLDENKDLIGYDMNWFAVLRAGWTGHLAALKSAQEAALAQFVREESARFARTITTPIVFTNVRIFDADKGIMTAPSNVLVEDGAIAKIEPADGGVPKGAYQIDASGKTLMAALWDMHGHISPSQYLHYISSGVLNVRDMANDPDYIARARKEIAANSVAAPDIHPMGFIDKRSPYSAPTGRLAETLDQALAFLRRYAAEDYAGVKLYSSIEPEWVPRLADEARALGLPVAGHIPSFMSTAEAIHQGYNEVTHINMVLLQLMGDWTIDTRTPQRFIAPGERGWRIDLDTDETAAFLDLMARRDIALDPTLAIFMDDYRARPGEIKPHAVTYVDRLPPSLRRSEIAAPGYNEGKEEAFRKTGELVLKLIKRLHDRGVRLLPGTDARLPGFVLVSELEFYAEAGIPNPDILCMATIGAARHMGIGDALGSVEIGKTAHLILIDGDPVKDLSALRRVDLVLKGDTLFDPKAIQAAQGIAPF